MDGPAGRPREVSCLALTLIYDYLESHGTSRRVLQDGLPYPPAWLDDRLNWIDYPTFEEIERRLASTFPDKPDLFFDVGLTFSSTKGLGFTRIIVRTLVSPYAAYSRVPTLVNGFLFPHVRIRFERTGPSTLCGHYRFEPGYPASDAFLDTTRGILTGIPQAMGAPPARVVRTRLGTHEARFDVTVAEWRGLGEGLRSWVESFGARRRVLEQSKREAARELEDANSLLLEKVAALTEAKASLDRRVGELTLLNALARTSTAELDARALLRRAATTISEGLGGAPVALFLVDGDEAAPVLVATAKVDAAELRRLRAVASAEPEPAARLAHDAGPVRLGGRTWANTPLVVPDRRIGAMLIGLPETAPADPALLESMAGQLAVSLEKANAYRLVAQLRDSLEIRVAERTAELVEARTALQDTVARLEQADRAKAEFFTHVNHELLTPIALVMGPLDDLQATLAAGRADDLVANVHKARRNAHVLHQLVQELLELARLDAGALPLDRTKLELVGIASDVVETLRPLADRKQLDLVFVPTTDPVGVSGDETLLRRVVVNLVGNAVKYVPARDRVIVRVERRGEHAVLEVEDTGPGIALADQQRVFERFARASADRAVSGIGVGLSMVRDLVRAHGGAVELESQLGRGALFRVTLPLDTAAHPPPMLAPPAPRPREVADAVNLDDSGPSLLPVEPRATPAPVATRARVLVVEDNPEMRAFLVQILRRAYEVADVADGQEARAVAERDLPDLIVSDVMMARGDGLTLCRDLKASVATRNIPIILVSARRGSEAVLEAFAAGADDYVTKPFSPPELLARANAQIRIRSLAVALVRMEKQHSLGVLSAGVAHELMNPLNAVVNAVPPLRRMVDRLAPDPAAREVTQAHALLEAVDVSGRRMHDVVKRILAYARQEAAPRALSGRLSITVAGVLTILGYRLINVTVHQRYDWDEPLLLYPEWIDQVLMNLVSNALDAMPAGGELWIHVERLAENVAIRVRDSGAGVPPELRERIFDPFFTTKPQGQGTGLGLAVAREIVGMHRGTLELDPAAGPGAAFVVTLPLARAVRASEG